MSGNVSFNVPELAAHIGKVQEASASVIATGTELPEKIRAHTGALAGKVMDPAIAEAVEGMVAALDGETQGLSKLYVDLGKRMGGLGDAVESFKAKSLELTGDGVTRVNDVVTVNGAEAVAQAGGGAAAFGGASAAGKPATADGKGVGDVPDF